MLSRALFLALIVCTTLQTVTLQQGPKRLGCYKSNNPQMFYDMIDIEKSTCRRRVTVLNCLGYCRSKRHEYTALYSGKFCLCDNTLSRSKKVNEELCRYKCDGDSSETCGGRHSYEIYITGQYGSGRIGCYIENTGNPFELSDYYKAESETTVAYCRNYCKNKGYYYTGVHAGVWCGCANSYSIYREVSDLDCNLPCRGNRLRTCGGYNRNEMYKTFNKHDIRRIGCYIDDSDRDLSEMHNAGIKATVPYCLNYCKSKGFNYTGVQSGAWCLCGNTYGRYGRASNDLECNQPCEGNDLTTCGGNMRNEIYKTFHEHDISRIGCYIENERKPFELSDYYKAERETTVAHCRNYCKNKGYNYTGVHGGVWCGCANIIGNRKVSDLECNLPCEGNQLRTCGGINRNEIYKTFHEHDIRRIGCYKDDSDRDLRDMHNAGIKATIPYCLNYCKSKGFNYTGVQSGGWCLCGNTYGRYGRASSDLECNQPCEGNDLTTCGGNMRNEIYNTFHEHDVKNSGDEAVTSTASTY